MATKQVSGGTVHPLPKDLRAALIDNATGIKAWADVTPLARIEFICWVEDAKQDKTRVRHIRRTVEELNEGQRRPAARPGRSHRARR